MFKQVEETDELITITHRYPLALRIVVGLLALLPLWGFYDLLLRPRWDFAQITQDNFWIMVIPGFIGIMCMLMVITILTSAVFGPDETFSFDKKRRWFTYTASKRPLHPAVKVECSFYQIPKPEVFEDTSGDGPTQWHVQMQVPGLRRKHSLTSYNTKAPAEALRDRLLT